MRRLLLVVLLFVAIAPASAQQTEQPPNILFCIADDWGWPHASSYGDKVIATPAFDRIAREGVLFEHAYVASPSCTPSRNSILTGQYHWRLGAGANLWSSLSIDHAVYPLLLEREGYHVGHWRKSWGPGKLAAGGYTNTHPAGRQYAKGLEQFLDARPAGKPFCFWLGAHDPHRPYQLGSGRAAGIDVDAVDVPGFYPDVDTVRSDIADYYVEVQRFDSDVQAALALLAERGELENTIIVVTGDHGMPFPRCKSNIYDMGVRVPLAIRWGKHIPAGRRIDDFVSLIDLAPTFLAAAGVAVPTTMNGRSLLPILKSAQQGVVSKDRTYAVYGKERHVACRPDGGGYPCRGIRTADWALIHNFEPARWPVGGPPNYADTDPSGGVGKGITKSYLIEHQHDAAVRKAYALSFAKRPEYELYDMRTDPDQLTNLAERPEHKAILAKLQQQLHTMLKQTEDPRVLGKGAAFDAYPYYGGGARRAGK